MTTVTGFTATRSQAIENSAVTGASVVGDNLVMTRHDGSTFLAGNVRGPQGSQGVQGPQGLPGISMVVSTNRPTSPTVGQLIYETDTAKLLQYYGATTGWRPPWNLPWGLVGSKIIGANQGSIVGTEVDVTGLNVTLTLPANRLLVAEAAMFVADSVANEHAAGFIRDNGGLAGRGEFDTSVVATFGVYTKWATVPYSPASGSHTWQVSLQRLSGTGTLTVAASITAAVLNIIDVGPNALPA